MGNGNNWLGGGDSVRELRSYYHSCHSLVQPYRFCQQSEVFSFLLFWTKWRIRMHSLYVYRFFAQLRMTGQKESKRKAKRCRALKKGGEVFKKDAELFLKPQGLLATSGVGCMASVYIHIGNANIHIGNVNIRIGSHVRTHRATRTYASSHTYVRIGQHVRTHWATQTYALAYTYICIVSGSVISCIKIWFAYLPLFLPVCKTSGGNRKYKKEDVSKLKWSISLLKW